MKKKTWIFLTVILSLLSVILLYACNPTTDEPGDTDNGPQSSTTECPHEWVKKSSTAPNCISHGRTTYTCLLCSQSKIEEDDIYGQHNYIKHICTICGARENGLKTYKSGNVTGYLYNAGSAFSDTVTYSIVFDGAGAMADYNKPQDAPWYENIASIVSIEFTDKVTHIGDYAFSGYSQVTEVSFGNGIESIGAYALRGLNLISEINLGSKLKSIGEYAFADCSGLNRITLSKTTDSIQPFAFYGCRFLEEITLGVPHSSGTGVCDKYFGSIFGYTDTDMENCTQFVTENGVDYGFYVPQYLTDVKVLCDNEVPDKVFYKCLNIVAIRFEGSITTIGERAFYGMEKLEKVEFAKDTVAEIKSYAFADCVSLGKDKEPDVPDMPPIKQDMVLSSQLTTLGTSVFFGCRSLQTVIFTDNAVTEIPMGTFENCTALTKIELPESLKYINARAFYACSSLAELKIPKNVLSLGTDAFGSCTCLNTLYIDSESVVNIINDNSKVFLKAIYIYLDGMNKTAVSTGSYIYKNFMYARKNETDNYHLWKKVS